MKYLISDLARLLGISTNAVRKYEKEGLISPKRDSSNYRWYDEEDVTKLSMIRIYTKCGFSHAEIRQLSESGEDKSEEIYRRRLDSIDNQLRRLKLLRHWLKDNIELIEKTALIGDGFYLMECPPVIYMIYSSGGELLRENGKLDAVSRFMYGAAEVQLIRVFRKEDLENEKPVPHMGWAVKEMDIGRQKGLKEILEETEKFTEYYPKRLCLYSVFIAENDRGAETDILLKEHFDKIRAYMEKEGFSLSGDVMQFIVTALNTLRFLTCVPIN